MGPCASASPIPADMRVFSNQFDSTGSKVANTRISRDYSDIAQFSCSKLFSFLFLFLNKHLSSGSQQEAVNT